MIKIALTGLLAGSAALLPGLPIFSFYLVGDAIRIVLTAFSVTRSVFYRPFNISICLVGDATEAAMITLLVPQSAFSRTSNVLFGLAGNIPGAFLPSRQSWTNHKTKGKTEAKAQ